MTDLSTDTHEALLTSEFMSVRPIRSQGVDTTGFRFDPASQAVLDSIDKKYSVGQMVDGLGIDVSQILQTLNTLKNGGLVTWNLTHISTPRNTLQGASPPWQPTSEPPKPPAPAAPETRVSEPAPRVSEPSIPATAPESEGVLSQDRADKVFTDAARQSFTGAICFERQGERVTFYFEQGQPLGVHSTAERHDHGNMLKTVDLFDDERLDQYRTSITAGLAPEAALRESGIRTRDSMNKVVNWRGKALMKEILTWTEGTYSISPSVEIPGDVMRGDITVKKKGPTKWRKENLNDEQSQFIADNLLRYIVPTDRAEAISTRLGLDKKETRYVSHLLEASPMTLRHAMTVSPLFKAVTRKLLFLLVDEGVLELHEENPNQATPIPIDELESYAMRLDYDDHFTILGAHAVSIEEEIGLRHQRLLRIIDPDNYKNASPQHLQMLAKIRSHIDRAWEVLGNEKSRREYRKSVYSAYQLEFFYNTQIEKATAALNLHQNPKAALPIALSAWDLRPGSLVAGAIIVKSLEALNRYSEARKYKVGS